MLTSSGPDLPLLEITRCNRVNRDIACESQHIRTGYNQMHTSRLDMYRVALSMASGETQRTPLARHTLRRSRAAAGSSELIPVNEAGA
jgi:hypothetical protein